MSAGQIEQSETSQNSLAAFADTRLAGLYRHSRAFHSVQDFERDFLGELREMLSATGVAVWHDPGGESLYLRHECRLPADELRHDMTEWQRHGRLLRWAAADEDPRCIAPGWTQDDMANPTRLQLLIAGASGIGRQQVILEVFREAPAGEDVAAESDLRLLQLAAGFAADYVTAGLLVDEKLAAAPRRRRWEFIQQIYPQLDPRQLAFAIANDGAQALGCDRVSMLLRKGRRTRVTAVSGQTQINRRANAVKLVESLADHVLRHGEAVVYSAAAKECPASIEGPLTAYMAAAGTATLIAVPLPASDPRRKPLGVLIVEDFEQKPAPAIKSLMDGVTFVANHAALALRNAVAHDQIVLAGLRGRIGRTLADARWPRWLAATTVLTAVVAVLWFVPWQLKTAGTGTLRAEHRSGVFAPDAGVVRSVDVSHGTPVKEGQTILVLENDDLSVRHQQATEELIGVREQIKLREAERSQRGLSSLRQIQIDGEIAELTEREAFLKRQAALLNERLARLTLSAPQDGVIATWNPRQQLLNRPVDAGNLLLQVIAEDGPWRLKLEIPDVDAGPVLRVWEQRSPDGPAPAVEYVLATHPERRYRGRLIDVAPRTETLADRHVLFVTVEPDLDDPPPLRDGAEVRGKIHCGERRLGYVMFREVIEFVQSRILF